MIFTRKAKAIKISRDLTEENYFSEFTCSLICSMKSKEAYDAKYGRIYENKFYNDSCSRMDVYSSRDSLKDLYYPLTNNNIVIFQSLIYLTKELKKIERHEKLPSMIFEPNFYKNDLKELDLLITENKTPVAKYNDKLYIVIRKDETNKKKKWFFLSNGDEEISCNIEKFNYLEEFNSIEEYNHYIFEIKKINENSLHSLKIINDIKKNRIKSITKDALCLVNSLEKELLSNKLGLYNKIEILEEQSEVEINVVLGKEIFDICPDLTAKDKIIELMIKKGFLKEFDKDYLNNSVFTKDSFDHFCWKKELKFSYKKLTENAIGLKTNSNGDCFLLDFIDACCNLQKLRNTVIDFFESI